MNTSSLSQNIHGGTSVKNMIFLKIFQFSENHFFRGFKLSTFTYQYKNFKNKFQSLQNLPLLYQILGSDFLATPLTTYFSQYLCNK